MSTQTINCSPFGQMLTVIRKVSQRWPVLFVLIASGIVGIGCGGSDKQIGSQDETGEAAKLSAAAEAAGSSESAEQVRSLSRRERMLREAEAQTEQQREVAENRRPRAVFTVSPQRGWAGLSYVKLDASLSSDDWDLSGQIDKRWDFDGDGTWDTPFSSRSRQNHIFPEAGIFRPRLLVKDSSGLQDSLVGDQVEILPECPPPDFALVDQNPNSPTRGETFRLSDQRGHPLLVWFTSPSK